MKAAVTLRTEAPRVFALLEMMRCLALAAAAPARAAPTDLTALSLEQRYALPAADVNWQNAFEQDGRAVRLKLSCKY